MNPKTNFYFTKNKRWQKELEQLRMIVLDCGLTEELKWGVPCYTFQGHNIVLIHVFKEYCALLLFKGALLKDTAGILVQQTKNVQAGRQIRFTDLREIIESQAIIKSYIKEAIKVEKAGLKVEMKQTAEYEIPVEFQRKLDSIPALKIAFKALTPDGKEDISFIFQRPNNPRRASQGWKNTWSRSSMEKV